MTNKPITIGAIIEIMAFEGGPLVSLGVSSCIGVVSVLLNNTGGDINYNYSSMPAREMYFISK